MVTPTLKDVIKRLDAAEAHGKLPFELTAVTSKGKGARFSYAALAWTDDGTPFTFTAPPLFAQWDINACGNFYKTCAYPAMTPKIAKSTVVLTATPGEGVKPSHVTFVNNALAEALGVSTADAHDVFAKTLARLQAAFNNAVLAAAKNPNAPDLLNTYTSEYRRLNDMHAGSNLPQNAIDAMFMASFKRGAAFKADQLTINGGYYAFVEADKKTSATAAPVSVATLEDVATGNEGNPQRFEMAKVMGYVPTPRVTTFLAQRGGRPSVPWDRNLDIPRNSIVVADFKATVSSNAKIEFAGVSLAPPSITVSYAAAQFAERLGPVVAIPDDDSDGDESPTSAIVDAPVLPSTGVLPHGTAGATIDEPCAGPAGSPATMLSESDEEDEKQQPSPSPSPSPAAPAVQQADPWTKGSGGRRNKSGGGGKPAKRSRSSAIVM